MPKTGNRTGGKGGQYHNKNAVKHGGYVQIFDGRTRDAKEIQTTAANWIADLGGADNVSSMEMSLVNDLAVIAWRSLRLGREIVNGNGKVSESVTKDFLRFHGALVEGLCKLGLKRRAREVGPRSLSEYLQQKQAQQQETETQP